MAKQCGINFLVQVEDQATPLSYNTVFSMRDTSLSISNEQVDVTDKGSSSARQLLSECGVNTMSISGSGLLDDEEAITELHGFALTGAVINIRLVSDAGDQYLGPFQVASFERTGSYNGAEEYSVSLESASLITYTPAP